MNDKPAGPDLAPWYRAVTGYQWLVLALASAGWIFDVYEGQIFNLTSEPLLKDILAGQASKERIDFYRDFFLGIFLAGGALGGILFGSLADRWGRRPVMIVTILFYSIFSGLTYFASSLWEIGALRFLVAMGVGGEWSVAAALVAEIFPARARPYASSIFHASSVLGTWIATGAALVVGDSWRYVYILGVLPALLVVAVQVWVAEPESAKQSESEVRGSLRELLSDPVWGKRAILGMLLAAVGLAMFWAVTVAGQELARSFLEKRGVPVDEAKASGKSAYGFIETAGGGLGLICFGPLAMRLGRRRAFIFVHLAALVIVPITCYAPREYWQLLALLPIYGFFTLGMHAGYAVYFPELFPARLRATGAGFCFSGGRLLGGSILFLSGWLKSVIELRLAVTILSSMFLLGVLIVWFMPETKGQPLPE